MEPIVQILGALLILAAFVLAQAGRVATDSLRYLAPNLVGSGVLAFDAYAGNEWGFLLLEGAWAVVSAASALKAALVWRARRLESSPRS